MLGDGQSEIISFLSAIDARLRVISISDKQKRVLSFGERKKVGEDILESLFLPFSTQVTTSTIS